MPSLQTRKPFQRAKRQHAGWHVVAIGEHDGAVLCRLRVASGACFDVGGTSWVSLPLNATRAGRDVHSRLPHQSSNSFTSPPTPPGTNSTLHSQPHPARCECDTRRNRPESVLRAGCTHFRPSNLAVASAAAFVLCQTHRLPPARSTARTHMRMRMQHASIHTTTIAANL
jgi:hypothetical protein